MKKATVDLTNCKHWYDFHERFQKSLDFPDYYGKNLPAFWDCLSVDCDVDFITIVGSKTLPEDLQKEFAKIKELLEDHKKKWENTKYPFDYEIID